MNSSALLTSPSGLPTAHATANFLLLHAKVLHLISTLTVADVNVSQKLAQVIHPTSTVRHASASAMKTLLLAMEADHTLTVKHALAIAIQTK